MSRKIIAGRYELLKEVGRGGTSIVYLASDTTLNKNWAVKKIDKGALFTNKNEVDSLLKEAEMMKNLDHPALPRIVDIIENESCYYIVMDFVEGESMQDVLKRTGPQSQKRVIEWGLELASILRYLHSQNPPIIYRDLKPANIILQPNGNLKLIDFGIARTYKEGKTKDTQTLGTRGYAAPEQYAQSKGCEGQTDERTDIYNLGVTLYELVTGKDPLDFPYELLPIRKIDPSLSEGLEKIIIKCTQHNPDNRIQSAERLMQVLLNYEKLDNRYINEKKKLIKKAKVPFALGITLILISSMLFYSSVAINNKSYEKLITYNTNSKIRMQNLSEAIRIKPKEKEAYILLAEEMAKDGKLTETEAEQICSLYSEAESTLKKDSIEYLEINFSLGESFLIYFTGKTDDSVRNKILTAMPYFERVVRTGNSEYENYSLAASYYALGKFYREYIIGESSLLVKGLKKEDYEKLFNEFENVIKLLRTHENEQVGLIVSSIILTIIDEEKYNIARCIPKAKTDAVIKEIIALTEDNPYSSIKNLSIKEDIASEAKRLGKNISVAYEEVEKENFR